MPRSCHRRATASPHAPPPLTTRQGARMGKSYLMSRKWALTDRFTITDSTGIPQFEVQGRFALSKKLSARDTAGAEVAVISCRGLSTRYEILPDHRASSRIPRSALRDRLGPRSSGGAQKLLRAAVFRRGRPGAACGLTKARPSLDTLCSSAVADQAPELLQRPVD